MRKNNRTDWNVTLRAALPLLLRLAPIALFLLWYLGIYLIDGRLPFIRDRWSFPYDFNAITYGDILYYFNRQPPGYMLYSKWIFHLSEGSSLEFGQALVLVNTFAFGIAIVCFHALLLRYLTRGWACLVACFAATGIEFCLYTFFVRYAFATLFWVLMLLYFHARAFGPGRRVVRAPWMVAALLSGLCLMMTRSFYIYFVFVYFGYWALCAVREHLTVPFSKAGLLASAVGFLLATGVPLALMKKNDDLYGHFSLSSWVYESQQRNVAKELRAGTVSVNVRRFIANNADLSDETKALYAAGLKWPTTRRVIRKLKKEGSPALRALIKKRYPPRADIPKKRFEQTHLYHHVRSGNGYLTVPLLQEGARVSGEIFKAHWRALVPAFFNHGSKRALCYSAYFFGVQYGADFCDSEHSAAELLGSNGPDFRVTGGCDYMSPTAHYIDAFGTFIPVFVTRLQVAIHQLLLPWIVVLSGFVLLFSAGRIVLRGREDTVRTLAAALVAYSFLAGVLGDYHEAARYSIYWKLPALLLAAWFFQAAARFISGLARRYAARSPSDRAEPPTVRSSPTSD